MMILSCSRFAYSSRRELIGDFTDSRNPGMVLSLGPYSLLLTPLMDSLSIDRTLHGDGEQYITHFHEDGIHIFTYA